MKTKTWAWNLTIWALFIVLIGGMYVESGPATALFGAFFWVGLGRLMFRVDAIEENRKASEALVARAMDEMLENYKSWEEEETNDKAR